MLTKLQLKSQCNSNSSLPNKLVHGASDTELDVSGHSISQIEMAVAEVLNIKPGQTSVYVDGKKVLDRDNFYVMPGQRIEWMKERGEKGGDIWSYQEFKERFFVDDAGLQWCLDAGMKTTKGIDNNEALRFGEILKEKETANGRRAVNSSPYYDDNTCTITWEGKTCHLGNTIPFKLFKRMAASPGRYIDVETLKDSVWGHDEDIDTNCVQRHFTDLRKKLGKAGITEFSFDGKTNRNHYALLVKSK